MSMRAAVMRAQRPMRLFTVGYIERKSV